MALFPATYTTLSAAALRAWLGRAYALGDVATVELFHRGLNDTYLVGAALGRYVLRVYRHGWRSRDAIAYELDALRHLAASGVAVALPIVGCDGGSIACLPAPEGERFSVLFDFVPGRLLADTDEDSSRYGAAAAALHSGSRNFHSSYNRLPLDLNNLIEIPMAAISPRLAHRPEDLAELSALARELRDRVAAIVPQLESGFCHGDLHTANAHIADGRITFFDFDCCGPGWRAYDLAVFRWSWGEMERGEANWQAFLKGYRERRAVAASDLDAVPLFVAIRSIWLRGLHAANSGDWGRSWLNDRYWDRFLKHLRAWREMRLHF
jgi:Ser/Thr protein kinase RdoA (MazF antagonist)